MKKNKASSTAVCLAFLLSAGANAALIDDFDGGFDEVLGNASASTTAYANAIGGDRELSWPGSGGDSGDALRVTLTGGGGGGNGILQHEESSSAPFGNESKTRWEAGGADLTDGGSADRFLIEFLNVSLSDAFTLSLISGTGNDSVDFMADATSGTKTILFSEFNNFPVDFTNIAVIDLFIDGASNASDIRIDEIRTASVVPVPAAAWLFGSAIGLLGWIRRKTT